jgi:branched-chain amino acid transport system permease protein
VRVAGAFVVVGVALVVVPLAGMPAFYEAFLYLVLSWIALATSWNVLSGYSGYFSFGHGAFFGAGVYTTATLAGALNVPFLLTLPVAALVSALLGLGIGAVVFRLRRLRGELFALLTLAVTFVLATVVLNTRLDGGPGVYLNAVTLPRLYAAPNSTLYVLALAVAWGAVAVAYAVQHSKLGAGLFAIHDDEDVAEVLGVPTYRAKLLAFGLSCGLAGVAGGIQAMFVTYVTVGETFSITVPLYVVLMSVLGGARHWLGPAVGATVVTSLTYVFAAGDRAVVGRALVGLILIVVIVALPEGIVPRLARRRARRPPAIDVTRRETARPPSAPTGPGGRRVTGAGAPLLSCVGVAKQFSGIRALGGVTFDVGAGEIVALIGPNGSGKSTLINVVSGHYRADAGRIVFEGRDIARLAAHRIAKRGLARTYQIPRPFARLSVRDNVAVAGMFGATGHDRPTARREAARWLDFAGLADRADAFPAEVNLHQRKFLELARALASEPRLLFLDEVLSGLTPSEMSEALALIRRIREGGTTVVFVEHVIRAVTELADRVVVLNHGEVIASGSPADIVRHPDVVEAYLGAGHA